MNEGGKAAKLRHQFVEQAMRVIADDLLGRAVRDAPVEEGTLRGSGSVDIDVTPGRITAEVSFDTVYAARQHEEITWRHPKGGKAKYLEDNLKAMGTRYRNVLEAAQRKAL